MTENPLREKGFVPGDYSDENYNRIDLHRPYVDRIVLVSPTGKPMHRETDLIDVWFKAYVVRASTLRPDPVSKVLYVELLDDCGRIAQRRLLRLDSLGRAWLPSGIERVKTPFSISNQ